MCSLRSAAKTMILLAILLLATSSNIGAQPYPADGYVGVYFDRAGTVACGTAPIGPTTLHILATLAGATQDGITGAEFRLEVSNSSGYFLIYSAVPGSCDINCTDALDLTPCVGDIVGASLTFPQCQASDDAGPGRVYLGTITVVNVGGGPFTIDTKRRNPSSDPQFLCPLFFRCDEPQFTKVCMTWQEGDPALGGREPVAFRTVVNDPNCSGPPACVVGVESRTWSVVKHI